MATPSPAAGASSTPPRPRRMLHNRVAIVTGAGSEIADGIGNGRAAAILLAEAGASVVCVDTNIALAERTVAIINSSTPQHGRAVAFTADVTDASQCAAAVAFAVSTFNRLDILVNNVGIMGAHGTAEEVDMEAWARTMQINVSSMVLMAKYAIPEMKKNNYPSSTPSADAAGVASVAEEHQIWKGAIVNIGSVAGFQGGTANLVYPTSKGAVVNMTRAMAHHHAADGIRVNCVCPGMLYTPMMYAGGMTDEVRKVRRERSLLKTEGNGWDCGAAVRFLASDEARWMTGVILPVDAGATASTATEWGDR